MKVVIISSSYRLNGGTKLVINKFIEGMKSSNPNCNVKEIELLQANIEYCKGCMACINDKSELIGECILKDGMKDILDECISSDILVFASPIYEGYVTSIMKKFMERTLCLHKLEKGRPKARIAPNKNKKGVILLVSGVPYPINVIVGITKAAKKSMKILMKAFGIKNPTIFLAGDIVGNENNKKKYSQKSFELGQSIILKNK